MTNQDSAQATEVRDQRCLLEGRCCSEAASVNTFSTSPRQFRAVQPDTGPSVQKEGALANTAEQQQLFLALKGNYTFLGRLDEETRVLSSGAGGQAAVQGQREHLSPEQEKVHGLLA